MSSSDSDGFKAFAAPSDFASLTSPEDLLPKAVPSLKGLSGSSKPEDPLLKTVPSSIGVWGPPPTVPRGAFGSSKPEDLLPKAVPSSKGLFPLKTVPSLGGIGAFGSSKPEDLLPKTVPSSMALFGSSKPKPKDPLPTTDFNGQPTSPPNRKPGWGSVFDMEHFRQTKPLIESSTDSSKLQDVPPSLFGWKPPARPTFAPSSPQPLFGSSKPPVFDSVFGQPRPTFAPVSSPPSTLYGAATSGRAFGAFGVETSPRVQSKGSFSSDSGSETPTVGIFGPACPFRASYNSDKLATFLSGDAHDSCKETFDLKLKGVKDELPSPSKPYFPGSSATEDALRGELESLSLLEDLIKIEELLQVFTAGYTDTDLELIVGCSWIEGIYIASIQEKMKLIGRFWKANFDPLDTEHIEAVDGVPRSQGELKILLNSIAG